jgi:hypothetical protein
MSKRKFNNRFNGGQRLISTIQEHSSNFIANMLLKATNSGKSLDEVLTTLQGRDHTTAVELIFADPRLVNLKFVPVDEKISDEERPRIVNRTKLLQAKQKEEEKKEQELFALKFKLFQEQYTTKAQ